MNRRQRRNSVSCARDTTGWMQSAVSLTDFSSVASSSETRVGGSEFATSPNVYLGPYHKPLSTSTSTSGAPEGFDETEQVRTHGMRFISRSVRAHSGGLD